MLICSKLNFLKKNKEEEEKKKLKYSQKKIKIKIRKLKLPKKLCGSISLVIETSTIM